MSMRALCETRNRHLPNPVQSYKTSVQLLWTVLEKMQKIFIFSRNRAKLAQKLPDSGVIQCRASFFVHYVHGELP
jgi:hypothetical protein